ncbi:MAG: helix-turn-helix domain-containing protein [Egibacteraceae bacterium]
MTNSTTTMLHTPDELLTTGQAARMLGTSRQHVVDLCDSGALRYSTAGTHRRIRRGDLEAMQHRSSRMTREALQSLWLHQAVAGKLVADPDGVLRRAAQNLERQSVAHPRGVAARRMREWARLLNGRLDDLLDVLCSKSPAAIELRQNSPFAGVLSEQERSRVLDAFRSRAESLAR